MKRKPVILVMLMVATVSLFSSCDKIKEALKVDFDYKGEAIYVDIPIVTTTSEVVLGQEEFSLDLSEILDAEDGALSVNNIREINLKSIHVELVDNSANELNNFQNIASFNFQIAADELATKVVVEKANNPDTYANTLTLPVNGGSINIKDYALKPKIKYVFKGKLRRPTTKVLKAKITADYSFVVGV